MSFGVIRKPDPTIPYAACMRPRDMVLPPSSGSTLEKCAMCLTDVWVVDPSTKKYAPNARLVCLDCGVAIVESAERPQ